MNRPYSIADRRPIATRKRRWAKSIAHALERGGVSPNAISVAGMIAGILAGASLAATSFTAGIPQRTLWVIAAALVQFRLACNMLDGMVAVEGGVASSVGELYNEIPDRISDAAVLIGLGYAAGGSATLGYVATILAIMTAYVRAQGKAAGAPNEFCGPMAKPHRMFIVTLASLAAALLPQRIRQNAFDGCGIGTIALAIIALGCVVTLVRRLWRIAGALRGAP